MATTLLVAIAALVALEPAMGLVHRFLFHGPLWCWHKSHHEYPTARRLVRNDFLWVGPLLASAILIWMGGPALVGIGIGTIAYVTAYVVAHDGVAHGRFAVPSVLRELGLFRLIAHTHHLHHRGGRDGAGASPFAVYLAHLEYRWRLSAGYTPPTRQCDPNDRLTGRRSPAY
jgi:beta-carotene 3-hydroxylase